MAAQVRRLSWGKTCRMWRLWPLTPSVDCYTGWMLERRRLRYRKHCQCLSLRISDTSESRGYQTKTVACSFQVLLFGRQIIFIITIICLLDTASLPLTFPCYVWRFQTLMGICGTPCSTLPSSNTRELWFCCPERGEEFKGTEFYTACD